MSQYEMEISRRDYQAFYADFVFLHRRLALSERSIVTAGEKKGSAKTLAVPGRAHALPDAAPWIYFHQSVPPTAAGSLTIISTADHP
jgi:hypothetical protein